MSAPRRPLPVHDDRRPVQPPSWARYVLRDQEGRLLCPCCRMLFGGDELSAASWHVVHGHPLPVGEDVGRDLTAEERQVLIDSGLFPELEADL